MQSYIRHLIKLRWSLRGMLVVVTLGCLLFGWRTNRLYENKRGLKTLESYGFSTYIPSSGIQERQLSFFGSINLANLRLEPEDGVEGEYVVAPRLWSEIGRLTPLRSLYLTSVDLPISQEDAGWRRANFVKELDLVECRLRGDALEVAVQQMPRLEFLWLDQCHFEPRDLSCLSRLGHLKTLRIDGISLRAGEIASLVCASLQFIKLGEEYDGISLVLSDQDVRSLTQLRKLRELVLHTEQGLPRAQVLELVKCRNLESLTIRLEDDSSENIAALNEEIAGALPGCDVHLYGRESK